MKKTNNKTKKKIFSGVATALITPFRDNEIDYDAFEKIIEHQLQGGIDALVFCGTTGESVTLSDEEKKDIFAFAKRTVGGRVPLIFGSGTNSHKNTMRLSCAAIDAGADALLCVAPYYNKGTPRGIADSYREVCSLGVPVILYNVPSRTGVDVGLDILKQLSSEPNLCAVKECAGVGRISCECCEFSSCFDIYCGNDTELLPSLSVGAAGAVSVISNLYPKLVKGLYTDFVAGDTHGARAKHQRLHRMGQLLFEATNPAPIKYAMSRVGLCDNSLRLPMTALEGKICKKLDAEMKKIEQNI